MHMAIFNHVKTVLLLGALTGLLLWIGSFWGANGLTIAIAFSLLINIGSFWFSDKIVLAMYGAKKTSDAKLNEMVAELAKKAGIPKPEVYIVNEAAPNAFATGRSPKHSAVAVTTGALDKLSERELKGVLAHELSHIMNRDTLIQTVAATIAGVISYVAMMARFTAIFGGGGDRDNNGLGILIMAIITPILALIIQMAISRSREYLADESGARLMKDGKPLASALGTLEKYSNLPFRHASKATAHMLITNPFKGGLLSTHPATKERIKRLEAMKF